MMEVTSARIAHLTKLLLAYSEGNYHKKVKISSNYDDFDSILIGMNMFAEQLENTTVSRDFFSSIYNATSDMLLVISPSGRIESANDSASNQLGYSRRQLNTISINALFEKNRGVFKNIKKNLLSNKSYVFESSFRKANKKIIPVEISCSKIKNVKNVFKNYLLVINNISERKLAEQRILRTMVETQQMEQERIAADIHDGLGPDLSNIKVDISNLLYRETDELKRAIINNGLAKFDRVVNEIRNICTNIMPRHLRRFGLKIAINRFIDSWDQNIVKIQFQFDEDMIKIENPVAVSIYFIILEFINNTVKHGKAKNIHLKLSTKEKVFILHIIDDGCGFNYDEKKFSGRGLSNISTRIKAFGGEYQFITKPGSGTQLIARFRMKTNDNIL